MEKKNCRCGRPKTMPPHCARCGTTNVVAKGSSQIYRDASGTAMRYEGYKMLPPEEKAEATTEMIQGYFCRRCGYNFDTMKTCNAPRISEDSKQFQRTNAAPSAQPSGTLIPPEIDAEVRKFIDKEIPLTQELQDKLLVFGKNLSAWFNTPIGDYFTGKQ